MVRQTVNAGHGECARVSDEIYDVLFRYCRGVDRCDWELVRSAYHPDAQDDHGRYSGDVDGFIEWLTNRHRGIAQSMHFLGNSTIEIDGDRAKVETYCVVYQTLSAEQARAELPAVASDGDQQTQVRCRYLDLFERRDGAWKILRRVVAYESRSLEQATNIATDAVTARRDEADPLYSKLGVPRS